MNLLVVALRRENNGHVALLGSSRWTNDLLLLPSYFNYFVIYYSQHNAQLNETDIVSSLAGEIRFVLK